MDEAPFDTPAKSAEPRRGVTQTQLRFAERSRRNEPLRRISQALQLPPWDVLLVGDGSGTGGWAHQLGAGWACVCATPNRPHEMTWGGLSTGSILLAELAAPLFGLYTYENRHGIERRRLARANSWQHAVEQPDAAAATLAPVRVCVLCDNEAICTASRWSPDRQDSSVDGPLWAAWRGLLRKGYDATFVQIPRLSIELNWAADQVAGRARETIQADEIGRLLFRQVELVLDGLNRA